MISNILGNKKTPRNSLAKQHFCFLLLFLFFKTLFPDTVALYAWKMKYITSDSLLWSWRGAFGTFFGYWQGK